MIILSIDTTGLSATASLVKVENTDVKVIGEITTNYHKTHSQTIMPIIDNLLLLTEVNINDISYIACSSGPGSFTGLRIGAATAKGLAHGLGVKIIPIPTLDGLAFNIYDSKRTIIPIMDARRNQVYTAYYNYVNGKLEKTSDYLAIDILEVIDFANSIEHGVVFVGDGVYAYKDVIGEKCKDFLFANENNNFQKSGSIGVLASQNIEKAISFDAFEPFYIRKSQAEREFEENNSNGK